MLHIFVYFPLTFTPPCAVRCMSGNNAIFNSLAQITHTTVPTTPTDRLHRIDTKVLNVESITISNTYTNYTYRATMEETINMDHKT